MTLRKTAIRITAEIRTEIADQLTPLLADLIDLHSQTKQAHWNVRGPAFITQHELYDKLADSTFALIDPLAERITTLGATARGTVRDSAGGSRLKEFPTDGANGVAYTEALIERFAFVANHIRESIDIVAECGDAVTADLLTGMLAELDKSLWFLEAHHDA